VLLPGDMPQGAQLRRAEQAEELVGFERDHACTLGKRACR
jgi:hypothetical protein